VKLGRQLSHIGALDQDSDKLSTEGSYAINDAERPAIEQTIASGDCTKAKAMFDAMVKRSDLHDNPLWKKLQACGGGATIEDIERAESKGDYDVALAAAEKILAKDPGNQLVRRYAASAACMMRSLITAQGHIDKITDPKQKANEIGICKANGVPVK